MRLRVSPQMERILEFVASPEGVKCSCIIARHVFDHRRKQGRWDREFKPLTATQRASLSRSIRRLIESGLVSTDRPRDGLLTLTEAGKAWLVAGAVAGRREPPHPPKKVLPRAENGRMVEVIAR